MLCGKDEVVSCLLDNISCFCLPEGAQKYLGNRFRGLVLTCSQVPPLQPVKVFVVARAQTVVQSLSCVDFFCVFSLFRTLYQPVGDWTAHRTKKADHRVRESWTICGGLHLGFFRARASLGEFNFVSIAAKYLRISLPLFRLPYAQIGVDCTLV
ncbi:uncharacterized protein LOC143174853 [Nomia melanderi]|uniref:uncharacterized protein LOC143174853 n=1 Tax=Nomia melanderi TaxID=2448451 RepID=UPI003FCE343C